MAFKRQDLCSRVLGMLNRLDVDNPPSAGDVQLINGLIDASVDRLLSLNLLRRDASTGLSAIDFGSADNIASGAIDNRVFVPLARVITRDVASDFGADAAVYETLAQQGEASLAQLRYKGPVGASAPSAPTGIHASRLHLIYETLQTLGIVGVNEPASVDAIDKVDRLINPVLSQLNKRSVYSATDPGTYGSLTTGGFPDSDVGPLAQILARPAALALGAKFIQGQVSEYIQLASDGENQLRQMRQELDMSEPISFRDY